MPVPVEQTDQVAGRVLVGTIADDDIDQHNAEALVAESLDDVVVAYGWINHRVRLALGELIISQIDH